MRQEKLFTTPASGRRFGLSDAVILVFLAFLIYAGVRLALDAPEVISGREISLELSNLPRYAGYSVGRMFAAYLLSLLFTLVYGYIAAYNRRAERVMMPILDVLQSVPILSFLPVVLLSLSAVLPQDIAAELASIVLIFTSQVWNMTFAWFQSLTTIPKELREASGIFKLNLWLRLKTLELPFGAISLIWNSMMSWAGGWFFLMAAEIFTVGERDFRLPGLGAYLQESANQGDVRAILWGLVTLVLVVVLLDQLIWRPLLTWADRLKVEMVESDQPPHSWVYDILRSSRIVSWVGQAVFHPLTEAIDRWMAKRIPFRSQPVEEGGASLFLLWLSRLALAAFVVYGLFRIGGMLVQVSAAQWQEIALGLAATLVRVVLALLIAFAWTLPAGALIGTNRRLAGWLQPAVQVIASVPATALFPVILLALLNLPGGLNLAAVLLMLMGTQWYLLFNIIAGASAIPQDLKYTSALLSLGVKERWRILILPALFPYMITGAITASGGAWNASIVAEYVHFSGQTLQITGIGSLIAHATAIGDYPLLLASTLSMIVAVVLINRLIWQRLYRLAEERFRME